MENVTDGRTQESKRSVESPSKISKKSNLSPKRQYDDGVNPTSNLIRESEKQLEQTRKDIESKKREIDAVVEDLDEKLNDVLAQQEFEYLKSYNIYVKRKEKDLRDMIDKLNLKNSNNTLKDDKINMLEKTIASYRDD